ncbi:MAG: HAD family hydrolase [Deltaproteobacteria bacterium]|nr:HAD family hydrolase [Deltaproteobacteria bacterium]MBW2394688.1 HAD family hydrolase [Deltaproteobacteria bacterium]
MPARIPFAELDTVFLDAGNTLVSIDFERVAGELSSRGLACEPGELRRAEAAARPRVSAWAHHQGRTEGVDAFTTYLRFALEALPRPPSASAELAEEVAAVVREPGASDRLWCWVLPGTGEALERLRRLELRLVVVSNSDGTVKRALANCGLLSFFDDVVDSHLVGFEKPDRRIFDSALERTGARPEATVHVGDLYHADVLGARACGIHTALLDPFDDWGETDCLRLVDLGELADSFEGARS